MWRLDNTIQPYAWGSHRALATLQGRPSPSAAPEAELWMGAHPRGPSQLQGDGRSLPRAIHDDPRAMLGDSVVQRFGPRLPFLLKVLAAAEPLSLQAHPDLARARAGFEEEEAAGIQLDAPQRNYADPHAKPELVCALGRFVALCGFRAVDETRAFIEALAVPSLRALTDPLWARSEREGLVATVHALMSMTTPAPLVQTVLAAVERSHAVDDPWQRERAWLRQLGRRHPGDIGVVVALLLNLVELTHGEALFLAAGNLHCYLEGTAVEIMGASDNVLRGGLTAKHVDVPELLRVLDFAAGPVPIRRARPIDAHEAVYDTPSPEFTLSRVELSAGQQWSAPGVGPELLLSVDGRVHVVGDDGSSVALGCGESAFTAASHPCRALRAESSATVFRATVAPRASRS